MTRLDDLKQDQESLQHEIAELQRHKADLLKEIEKVRRKDKSLDTFNHLKQLLQLQNEHNRTKEPAKVVRLSGPKRQRLDDEYPIPEPVQHEFFDNSISQLMTKGLAEQPKGKVVVPNDPEMADCVLLENVYRMFGITAFPLQNPSRGDTSDLLGIRIEIFNGTELKFETPHYLILQRNSKTGKWDIFKHTVPIFVQVHKLAAEFDGLSDYMLFSFLRALRLKLQKTSANHQIVEHIRTSLPNNVKNLEKDLALETLKFDLNINSSKIHVLLNLSLDDIESCHLESSDFTGSERRRISAVLKGNIKNFEKRLKDVIYSLSDQ